MTEFEPLVFPKTHFKKNFGFSMDFGSSAIKIVYTTDEGERLRFNFISFPTSDLDSALDFLVKTCDGKLDPDAQVSTCGIGSLRHADRINKALNIRLSLISEIDTLFNAFKFITANAQWDDVFHKPSQTATDRGATLAKHFAGAFPCLSTSGQLKPWPYMERVDENDKAVRSFTMPQTVQYPAIIAMVGSGLLIGKINEDGSCNSCNHFSSPAGKTFLGLGSLINNIQGFDKLADMASRGDSSKVDVWASGAADEVDSDDEMYGPYVKSDHKEFAFGHAANRNKDEFRPEDIVAATTNMIAGTAANDSFFWADYHKIQQVFFIGGFATSTPYIREEIEKEFAYRRFANSTGHMCDCRTMKHGAHLGALGALMVNLGAKW